MEQGNEDATEKNVKRTNEFDTTARDDDANDHDANARPIRDACTFQRMETRTAWCSAREKERGRLLLKR